jgi:hypothetical protein
MIARLALAAALVFGAGAASAQDACTMFKVNTSMLNVAKDAGGHIYNDALFDGDTTCVTRRTSVSGEEYGFISYKLEGSTRKPVEGWAALRYLQALAPGAAPPAAAAPAAPAPAAPAPSVAAPAPGKAPPIRPEDVLRFDQPIPFGPFPVNGRSLKEMIDTEPLFSPLDGLPEELWKKKCTTCHQWDQARLCAQGATYIQSPRNVLRVPHPFGGALKLAMMRWAQSGCP